MAALQCAIWNTPAQLLEDAGDYQVIDSPRAGGKYWISRTGSGGILSFTDHAKRLLTTWLCEQRRSGVEAPKIRSYVFDVVKSRETLPITKRMTFALRYLGSQITQLGDLLFLGEDNDISTLRLLAETESKNAQELMALLQMLEQSGLVQGSFFIGGAARVQPTARGWQELDN